MSTPEYNPEDITEFFNNLEEYKEDLLTTVTNDFHGNVPIIDNKYKGALPTISEEAISYINTQGLLPSSSIQLSIVGGGCSGFNYVFEEINTNPTTVLDTNPSVVINTNPSVVIDTESLQFLYGATIVLKGKGFNKSLAVENPGAKASCGCGTSFSYEF